MIISLILTAIALLITYWFIQLKYHTKHLKTFLGPKAYPLVGSSLYFYPTTNILPTFLKFHKLYGSIFKLAIGFGPLRLSVADPKFLEYLLGSTTLIDKSNDYSFLHKWLGTGLLTSTGIKWKNHRKILTPAFHFQVLEQFVDVFNDYSDILVEKLKPEVHNSSTNIYPFVTLCSLDIICASAMGTNIKAQEDAKSEYVHSVKEMCRIIMERSLNAFKRIDVIYQFTRDYETERKAVKVLHDTTNSVITLRKQQLENENNSSDSVNNDDLHEKKTFLDILLNYKNKYGGITDENIREEVDTFMFEGHDTTSSGITFILYCLATNSDVQAKVMEELVQIFENDFTKKITYKDLQKMKYLEMVIKESLRLYPSVPIYARNVHEDVKYNDVILPKNLGIAINAFCIHRDPEIYSNPDCFNPERFTYENCIKRSPYAYIPFSAGSRNCIGQKFAILEMKAVVTKILINFELLPSEPYIELVLLAETILKSKTGVHIRLKKRLTTIK